MTTVLDDIRRLDAAHARGELTAAELALEKVRLMDAVPIAQESRPLPPARPPAKRTGIWPTLLLCALVLTICIGLTLMLTGDAMLSATLAITVLAAITVLLFRQLDS